MIKTSKQTSLVTRTAIAAMAALTQASPAAATNGYFSNGYGGQSKGLAGAGVALPTGVMGLAQNPAFGTKIGNSAEMCLTIFNPNRGFSVGGAAPLTPGTYDSSNSVFFIPCGGANFQINDRSSFGFTLYGNGGMNTEYGANTFAGLGAGSVPLGVNLEQLFIAAHYSFEVNDQLSLGVAPILAVQRFSATGLEAFAGFSSSPANVTNNGDDWSTGFGLNLGLAWQPSSEWTIGAAYRTKMDMGEFDRYAGLFAEQGDFDIPATATIGAAFTPSSNPALTLTAEYQHIFYSDVAAISNSGAVLATPLGADNGPGFGWDDMDVVRIAAQYRYNDKLTLRGGIAYNSDFIDDSEVLLNTLAPATIRWHASLGASYRLDNGWDVTAAYTHAFNAEKSGANQTPGFGQPITLWMDQNELTFSLSKSW